MSQLEGGTTGGDTSTPTFSPEQQEFVNQLVGKARVEGRTSAEKELADKQAKAKAAEETATLEQNREFETLSKQQAARIASLEPLEATLEEYKGAIETIFKARLKTLSDKARKAVEALPESLSVLEKLSWVTKNEDLFKEESKSVGTPRRGKTVVPDVGEKTSRFLRSRA
jgi:hypothetical protein